MEEQFIVQTSTPERIFVKVYRDFLNSGLLSGKEQIIFIHLKQYINFGNDNGTVQGSVYPTLATLARNVKMTEKTVRTVLQSLQQKNILEIKQQGLNKPNIYRINDSADMWKAKTVEDLKTAVEQIEEEQMIQALTAKGYCVVKAKELVSEPTKAHTQAPEQNHSNNLNLTTNPKKSQEAERYTLDEIQQIYEYGIMVHDEVQHKDDIDAVMNILHTVLNTTKKSIRVAGEDKPTIVVIGKLMKLDYLEILYVIKKYKEQTARIKNPNAYILTLLYHAKEQMTLDIGNLVSHDMKDWGEKK